MTHLSNTNCGTVEPKAGFWYKLAAGGGTLLSRAPYNFCSPTPKPRIFEGRAIDALECHLLGFALANDFGSGDAHGIRRNCKHDAEIR
jgi:hypothetical protein